MIQSKETWLMLKKRLEDQDRPKTKKMLKETLGAIHTVKLISQPIELKFE